MKHHRRSFLKFSAGSLLLMKNIDMATQQMPSQAKLPKGDLLMIATNWGFPGTLDEYGAKAKAEGYDGIELWWPMDKKGQDELFSMLDKYKLEVGFLCGGQQPNFPEHFKLFQEMTEAAATNKVKKPLYLNCHSGRDYFSVAENEKFIEHTKALAKRTGLQILHETHRSRILFAAPVAKTYFKKHPELRITFDVSHWCTVSESLLEDQPQTVATAIDRARHIHARVGHPEGPQVNDPRAPEWAHAVQAHLQWWDRIVEKAAARKERLTILTEFGPPDYMPTMPYSRKPLSDQWEVNAYMMKMLRERYQTH
jgi:sugar phosphate isomerase/epimerase